MAAVAPQISTVEGVDSPGRMPAVRAIQGQATTITWTFRDQQANPVNLTPYESDHTLKVRFLESMSFNTSIDPIEADGAIVTPGDGVVSAAVPDEALAVPGIYCIEWAFLNEDDVPVLSSVGYLVVERSQFAIDLANGPPTIPEIRLHLRDTCPEDNFLIDATEWDYGEIAACIARPVMFWNESLPPIGSYTTQNFPFRFHWLIGTIAGLYGLAASHYLRNRATYQAAGVTMDDKNKYKEYEEKSQRMWEEYKTWVKGKKASINADGCYGHVNTWGCDSW